MKHKAKTSCFASDENCHRSAFSLLTSQVIQEWFDKHGSLYMFDLHVPDGTL